MKNTWRRIVVSMSIIMKIWFLIEHFNNVTVLFLNWKISHDCLFFSVIAISRWIKHYISNIRLGC